MLTGVTCIHLYSKYAISDELPFLLLPCCDEAYVAVHVVVGATEGWEKTVSQVSKEWCVEICSKHAFSPAVELLPENELQFVLRQRQPPMVTLEVRSDGSFFFRLFWRVIATVMYTLLLR